MRARVARRSSTVAEPRRSRPPFLLVTGGKGGVGKTTLAANLGMGLVREGVRPLLVDLDFDLANLDVILGAEPERTVESFFQGERELAECIEAGPEGMSVLFAGSGAPVTSPDRARNLTRALIEDTDGHDLIVGDSPAGIGSEVLEFAARAARVLVVTTPDPAAVTDAYGVIKALDTHAREREREVATPELFVNLASGVDEAHSIAAKLATVCERFLSRRPRLVGWLPRSTPVCRSVAAQKPFVAAAPRSLAARSVQRLARRYASLAALAGPTNGTGGDDR